MCAIMVIDKFNIAKAHDDVLKTTIGKRLTT